MGSNLKLNYGCGRDYRDGFVNVDHSAAVRADLYGDLDDVFHVYGETFDFVLLSHVFEHIGDPIRFMEDLYLVCLPDAMVEVRCPYHTSKYAWSDPDHKRAISEATFDHFNRAAYLWTPGNPITPAHSDSLLPHCDFEPVSFDYYMAPEFASMSQEKQEYARKHLFNAVQEIRVNIRCVKPGRVTL